MSISTRTTAWCAGFAAVALGIALAISGHTTAARAAARPADAENSASSTSSTNPAPTPSPIPKPPTAASLLAPSNQAKYIGVSLPTGASGLPAFDESTGTAPNLNEQFVDIGTPFPATQAAEALAQGAYTLISWQSTTVPLTQITAGSEDTYLKRFAAAAKAFGWPVLIDFDHEFNGNWYSWGTQSVTPPQFVAAWQHIHTLFAQVNAPNILWVWSPNVVNPVPNVNLSAYWPGAQDVDIVGIVGYFTGQLGEDNYQDLFTRTENAINKFANKPFLITEVGAEQGPNKPAWITDLIQGVKSDAHMLGFIYFDEGAAQHKRDDWTLEDNPPALTAWRTATASMPLAKTIG